MSADTVVGGDALAFTLANSNSTIGCGNFDSVSASSFTNILIGDCNELVVFGFYTSWVESDPPLLVDIEPFVTVTAAYTAA